MTTTALRAIVLVNHKAGSADAAGGATHSLSEQLSLVGIDADVRQTPGKRLARAARDAAAEQPDLVIAGGGDGTISAVASALVGASIPLGILPLGTLNHFARDLGIPLQLAEAIAVIGQRNVANVDVGEVNKRYFLNNSSLGVYPRIVLDREAHRGRYGLNKWMALLLAIANAFRRFPLVNVRLSDETDSRRLRTPLVFVGNNRYELDLLKVGTRARIDRGELSLYVANVQSRWGLLRLAVRTLLGRLKQDRDFEALSVANCWVETRRRKLHVALDGEVVRMMPPLHYSIRPAALRVFVPKKQPDANPSGA